MGSEMCIRDSDPTIDEGFPAMKSIGYRQVWQYLDGRTDRSTMRDRAISASRQLAKRQLTWLRNTSGNVWFDAAHQGLLDTAMRYLYQIVPHFRSV